MNSSDHKKIINNYPIFLRENKYLQSINNVPKSSSIVNNTSLTNGRYPSFTIDVSAFNSTVRYANDTIKSIDNNITNIQHPDTSVHKAFTRDGDDNESYTDTFSIIVHTQSIVIILINVLLLICLISRVKLRLKPSIRCFLNLQLTHILSAILNIIAIHHQKRIWTLVSNGLLLEMFFSMLLKTLDKYIEIKFPFKHGSFKRFLDFSIIATWIIAFTLVITVWFCVHITQLHIIILSTFFISLSMIVLAFTNIGIIATARKHVRIINLTLVGVGKMSRPNHFKSIIICCGIVVSFMLLWLPLLIHNILCLIGSYKAGNTKVFTFIVVAIAMCNAIIDPIIFVAFNNDVKQLIRKTTSIRKRDAALKEFYASKTEESTTAVTKCL